MLRSIVVIAVAALLGLAAAVLVFLGGMRSKSPVVIDAVRRLNRAVTNPRVAKTAGAAGASASLIRHTGRTSSTCYETPVGAIAIPSGFLVALPYGTRADWLQNVLASGTATIVDGGNTHPVSQPTIVTTAAVAHHLPPKERRMLRLFKVDRCLHVVHAEDGQDGTRAGQPVERHGTA